MKNAVIILAAGLGQRFGGVKQYYKLKNQKTILDITVEKFYNLVDYIVIVINPSHTFLYQTLNYSMSKIITVMGGHTRQESARRGLNALKEYNIHKVLIHDGVRPFVTENIIQNVITELNNCSAIDLGIFVSDLIKSTTNNLLIKDNNIYLTQTPQGFHYNLILSAHLALKNEDFFDDISLYRGYFPNDSIKVLPGDINNIKITYIEDLTRYSIN